MNVLVEGLWTTILSMGIVFSALLFLAYSLEALRFIASLVNREAAFGLVKNNNPSNVTQRPTPVPAGMTEKQEKQEEEIEEIEEIERPDPKIVAVLTAAIMAMEEGPQRFRIRSYRKIDTPVNQWVMAARQEAMHE